jgi:crossover junction endodeoxyribonuclease RuvC
MSIILGIDPGLVNTGWGIISFQTGKLSFIACGTITTKATLPISERLLQIHQALTQVIILYMPTECAVEETFVNKNPSTSLKLGHARGAILLSISMANINLTEYAATLVKKSVVGVGRAEKQQINAMVKYILPTAVIDSEHSADALAVAICHSSFMRNNYDWQVKRCS